MKLTPDGLVLIVVLATYVLTTPVYAAEESPWYGIVGGGVTNFHKLPDNGGWYQQGWDYQHETRSSTFILGVGRHLNGRWDAELDYRDLGTFNGIVRFVGDENYNPQTAGCIGVCQSTQTAMVRADSKGVGLSIVLNTSDEPAHLFARAGVFLYGSRTHIRAVQDPSDPMNRGLLNIDGKRSWLATPFLGLGIKAGPVAIELNEYFKTGGQYAPMQRAETVTASIRMNF